MRHLASVLIGPILGFVTYALLGFAMFRLDRNEGWTGDTVITVVSLLAAGLAYAGLLVPRLSPLGPAIVGAAYLGLGLWIISDASSFVTTMPDDLVGLDNAGYGPGTLILALAVAPLATLVSPTRWASRRPGRPPVPVGPPVPPPHEQYGQYESPPPPFTAQPGGYQQPPPIGAPYSGPPSYGTGSPVAPQSGFDPYAAPRPDVTRRIE